MGGGGSDGGSNSPSSKNGWNVCLIRSCSVPTKELPTSVTVKPIKVATTVSITTVNKYYHNPLILLNL